jgi:hypothetical protein
VKGSFSAIKESEGQKADLIPTEAANNLPVRSGIAGSPIYSEEESQLAPGTLRLLLVPRCRRGHGVHPLEGVRRRRRCDRGADARVDNHGEGVAPVAMLEEASESVVMVVAVGAVVTTQVQTRSGRRGGGGAVPGVGRGDGIGADGGKRLRWAERSGLLS